MTVAFGTDCDVIATVNRHWREADCNARLIAAAPDLLAELRNLLDCIDLAARNGETIMPFVGYGQIHLDKARAAVAKAEPAGGGT